MYTANSMNCLCEALGLALPAGAETPAAELPDFPIMLNEVEMPDMAYTKYPLLVYKDITYFPMTWYNCRMLGLETEWSDAKGLAIWQNDALTSSIGYYPQDKANAQTVAVSVPDFGVTVNGQVVDNSKEQYPLLIFRDVTYFPLTWRFAHDSFGWDYTFDQTNGLVITPKATAPQPVISTSGKLPEEVRVTGNVVNIRSQATTESSVVVQVQSGDVLTVLSADGDWYQVLVEDGKIGWIANWLVETAEGTAQGQTNSLTASAILDAGRQSQVVLQTGVGNTVSVSQSAAGKLVLTAANNTTELFTAQSGSNLITQVTAEQTGAGDDHHRS